MQNKLIGKFIFFILAVFFGATAYTAHAQNNQQALEQEIFTDASTILPTDSTAENTEATIQEANTYGPFAGDASFTAPSEDLNAIDSAIVQDLEGGTQLIDLDIRTRPVYRYDTVLQPHELINNSNNELNSHLPRIYTNTDMKRILFEAIAIENISLLQQLLRSGDVDFNMADNNGNTLLDYAVKNKKYKVVKFLMYNKIGARNTRVDYMELALQYRDPNLIDIIEGVSPYYGDGFNEMHVVRALDIGFDMAIVSDIYDELSDAEKYQLFNYYAEQLHGEGLEFIAIQGYDLNRKMRTGYRVMEYGIAQGRYNETDQLMWLKKYFNHNHVYSAYQKLTAMQLESIKLAPQLASYGFNYDLTHDIRDRNYVMICEEEEPKKFDFYSRKQIDTEPFVVKGPFKGNANVPYKTKYSYYTKSTYEASNAANDIYDNAAEEASSINAHDHTHSHIYEDIERYEPIEEDSEWYEPATKEEPVTKTEWYSNDSKSHVHHYEDFWS